EGIGNGYARSCSDGESLQTREAIYSQLPLARRTECAVRGPVPFGMVVQFHDQQRVLFIRSAGSYCSAEVAAAHALAMGLHDGDRSAFGAENLAFVENDRLDPSLHEHTVAAIHIPSLRHDNAESSGIYGDGGAHDVIRAAAATFARFKSIDRLH